MERKISDELLKWKNDAYKRPMLLYGISGCGKTYSVLSFGKSEYKNTGEVDSSHASAARVWSLRQRKQMLPSPERPELYGFVCLYSTLLPQAGRQLEQCGRTSRDSHPSEDLSKLRTGVSL